MKKWIAMLLTLIIVLAIPLTVFAGDIPESLLHEDSQLFFGEVLAYHPDKAVPSITVSPVAVIKGDVKEGTQQHYTYPDPVGDFAVQNGKVYLFARVEEVQTIDIFEVTTYNTRTLRLRHVKGAMWERFERYLNQGKYGEAKVEGLLPWRADLFRGAVLAVVLIAAAWLWKRKKTGGKKGETEMKALKIWGWCLFAAAAVFYGTGVLGGLFNRTIAGLLYYGTSKEAILLTAAAAVCLLHAVTVTLLVRVLKNRDGSDPQSKK